MMKAYVNQTNTYEGSTVVVEHQDKDQAAGLELAESFIMCGHQAFRTHIKNIAVFIHKDDRMEVVPRSHGNCTEEIPVTVNGTDAFVDTISYVIKSAGSPIHCNDVAPPEVQGGR
jgi:hypothetical protein